MPLPARQAYPAAVLSGLLYWLAFPGRSSLGAWHGLLALVAFIPLWVALHGQTPRRAMALGLVTGTTMNVAGFTWLIDMLQTFSGFSVPICFGFALIVCAYQGGRLALMGWLFGRSTARGWPAAIVFVVAFIASELVYPLLFPWYFAATTYQLPALSQTAELGGPILVGAILVGVNLAIAEPLLARLEQRKILWPRVIAPLAVLGAAILFAIVRIPQVDAATQAADTVHVGIVQGNLGLVQKREDPAEALRRHLRMTSDLKAKGAKLVVWSESSVTIPFPERGYQMMMREEFGRALGVTTITGSVLMSVDGINPRLYNTALSIDPRGEVTGRYDKEYLLAFGEYLPLGETIPKLYEWSPNSGHFTSGTLVDPLPVTIDGVTHPVSVLICYEDILPAFTNHVVGVAKPELLVNMSNDAWFGDTAEPWEHVALAQLRAVEHRRYLVRSTNSGVSAIVDPVGRVVVHGATFDEEAIDATVHWMHGSTLYESIGDVPLYLLTILLVLSVFVKNKRGAPAVVTSAAAAALLMTLAMAGVSACSSSGATPPTSDAARHDVTTVTEAAAADSVATPEAATGDAGVCPGMAPVDFGGPTCDSCVAIRCCTVATRCFSFARDTSPDCAFLATCISECEGASGDAGSPDAEPSCEADCETKYGDGEADYTATQGCLASQCMNDAGTAPCNN